LCRPLAGKFGVASDVYSLGVVLLELLSGRPATADTADEVDEATDGGHDPDGLQVRIRVEHTSEGTGKTSSACDIPVWQGMVDPALGQVPVDVLRPLLALLNCGLSRRANQRPCTRDVLAQLLQLRDSLLAQAQPGPPEDLERAQVSPNWNGDLRVGRWCTR
jgi:serine/threonine protein kinase